MPNKLSQTDREGIEDALFAVHAAADQVLKTDKAIYDKVLKMNVEGAMYVLQCYKEELQKDEKFESYKLHLFVPMQINKLLELRRERKENVKQS